MRLFLPLLLITHLAAVDLPTDLGTWSWAGKPWEVPPEFSVANESGRDGRPAIAMTAATTGWDHCLTRTFQVATQPAHLRLRGWFRTAGVIPGAQSWMNGKMQLQFLDDTLQHLDPWPESNGAAGTSDWTWVDQELTPPAGTRGFTVRLDLTMCTGQAWFQDLTVDALAADGSPLELTAPAERVVTDTTGWWPFVAHEAAADAERVVDWSTRLDRPAGRSGRVRSEDGHFVSGDGKRLRFNGTSICPADFLGDRPKAARLAQRLAACGFNLVRLHHLDAGFSPKNLFTRKGGTRELDPQALDDLCFFIGELKQRGIYLWCDLLVTRRFTTQDGVMDAEGLPLGAKIAGIFDEKLIGLQQEYARQLLTFRNPYTGQRLVDDPQLAIIGITNENTVFLNGSISSWDALPSSYRAAADHLWQADRDRRKLPHAAVPLDRAWRQGDADAIAFLGGLQQSYYERMARFLRNELGAKALLTGNNFEVGETIDRSATRVLDFDDQHCYWDHPSGGWAATDSFTNRSQIAVLGSARDTIPLTMARTRQLGRPLTLSEWGTPFPSTHAAQNPLAVAAFAGWNDLDGLLPFVFSTPDWGPVIPGVYAMGEAPHVTLPLVAYNLSLLRGDFAVGPELRYPAAQVAALPPSAVFAGRLTGTTGGALPASGATRSPGGELVLADGILRVASPRTQGAAGLLGAAVVDLPALRLAMRTAGQVGAVSLDDLPLGQSRRVLLVATARAENSGQVYKAGWHGLREIGHGPILLEPPVGTVSLLVPAGQMVARVLDADGRRTARTVPVRRSGERAEITLGASPCLWLEIVVTP